MENNNPWVIEGSSKARLVSATPNGDELIAYVARVTSKDQSNPKIESLLKYCAKHRHFSVFEQADMTVEIVTPLAISVQILRHRSCTFQQFSGRYEDQTKMAQFTEGLPAFLGTCYIPEIPRLQDTKNRQNSIPAEDADLEDWIWQQFTFAYAACLQVYGNLIERGIAKEQARFVLPEGVYTRLYMKGNVRSFMHYLEARDDEGVAQHEHCEVARAIKQIFAEQFPVVYKALVEAKSYKADSECQTKVKVQLTQFQNKAKEQTQTNEQPIDQSIVETYRGLSQQGRIVLGFVRELLRRLRGF